MVEQTNTGSYDVEVFRQELYLSRTAIRFEPFKYSAYEDDAKSEGVASGGNKPLTTKITEIVVGVILLPI